MNRSDNFLYRFVFYIFNELDITHLWLQLRIGPSKIYLKNTVTKLRLNK